MHVILVPLSPANEVTESSVVIGLGPPPSTVVVMENREAGSSKVVVPLVMATMKSSDGILQA